MPPQLQLQRLTTPQTLIALVIQPGRCQPCRPGFAKPHAGLRQGPLGTRSCIRPGAASAGTTSSLVSSQSSNGGISSSSVSSTNSGDSTTRTLASVWPTLLSTLRASNVCRRRGISSRSVSRSRISASRSEISRWATARKGSEGQLTMIEQYVQVQLLSIHWQFIRPCDREDPRIVPRSPIMMADGPIADHRNAVAPLGGRIPQKNWEIRVTSLVGVGLALFPATCSTSTGSAAQGQDTVQCAGAGHRPRVQGAAAGHRPRVPQAELQLNLFIVAVCIHIGKAFWPQEVD